MQYQVPQTLAQLCDYWTKHAQWLAKMQKCPERSPVAPAAAGFAAKELQRFVGGLRFFTNLWSITMQYQVPKTLDQLCDHCTKRAQRLTKMQKCPERSPVEPAVAGFAAKELQRFVGDLQSLKTV